MRGSRLHPRKIGLGENEFPASVRGSTLRTPRTKDDVACVVRDVGFHSVVLCSQQFGVELAAHHSSEVMQTALDQPEGANDGLQHSREVAGVGGIGRWGVSDPPRGFHGVCEGGEFVGEAPSAAWHRERR